MKEPYTLPLLPYDYTALEPVISEEQLRLHHEKHHKSYVDRANEILAKIELIHEGEGESDYSALVKKLSFNLSGHVLHTLFWDNLISPEESGQPEGGLLRTIEESFGSFERMKELFLETAIQIEGSGWAALTCCSHTKKLLITEIGNHNLYLYPNHQIIFVLDMWEHAYYLDYKNDKKTYASDVVEIVNWEVVGTRFARLMEASDTEQ